MSGKSERAPSPKKDLVQKFMVAVSFLYLELHLPGGSILQ